jgi:hypothetical protein
MGTGCPSGDRVGRNNDVLALHPQNGVGASGDRFDPLTKERGQQIARRQFIAGHIAIISEMASLEPTRT